MRNPWSSLASPSLLGSASGVMTDTLKTLSLSADQNTQNHVNTRSILRKHRHSDFSTDTYGIYLSRQRRPLVETVGKAGINRFW